MLSLLKSAKACCLIINLLTEASGIQLGGIASWNDIPGRHLSHLGDGASISGDARLQTAAAGCLRRRRQHSRHAGGGPRDRRSRGRLARFASQSIWYAEPLCVDSEAGIAALSESDFASRSSDAPSRALCRSPPAHDSGPEKACTRSERLRTARLPEFRRRYDPTA